MIDSLTLPARIPTRAGELVVRVATPDDLDALAALLTGDEISASRGDADDATDAYVAALAEVQAMPGHVQVVAARDGRIVGTMQLSVIPGLARRGARRLQVETVRVSTDERGGGIGSALMRWVMADATAQTGTTLVQLTSDLARTDAHRFYERLGFAHSHAGFKLDVTA